MDFIDMRKRGLRIGGFVAKELIEIIRQPRLLLALILGPFVIMLLFGVGYVGEPGTLRAILVVPDQTISAPEIANYRQLFGTGNVQLIDVTNDQDEAVAQLRAGDTDVVVVMPANAARQVGAGGQAQVLVLYNTIDPTRSGFIVLVTILYSNDLNKRLIAQAVQRGQGNTDDISSALSRIDDALAVAQARLSARDRAAAAASIQQALTSADLLQLNLGLLLALLQSEPFTRPSQPPSAEVNNLTQGSQVARQLTADLQALQVSAEDPNSDPETVRLRIQAVRQDISNLQALTNQFGRINPYALAAPLYGKAENIAPLAALNGNQTVFYTPGALVLLLQHMAITLSALSMARERERGRIEIFRVSPLSPGEILIGKYIGFGLFLSLLALVLVLLVHVGLSVPVFGGVGWLAVVLLLLIWASLGAGFAISMLARTQRQAVQMTMLALLASVFFSGLFVPVDALSTPISLLADVIPATHGVVGLQDVMLKGTAPTHFVVPALAALGLAFALFARWRFGAEFRRF